MKPLELKTRTVKGKCLAKGCSNQTVGNLCGTCRSRKSRLADPVKYAYNNLKNRARQRGKGFSLTLCQFRKFCIKTSYIAGKGVSMQSYTIDRIDNRKGYHIDNIQVLSKEENITKYLEYDWHSKQASVRRKFKAERHVDDIF